MSHSRFCYVYIYRCVCTLCKQVLQLHKLDGCILRRRKTAVRQFVVALSIVPFGRLSLTSISCTSRALSSICRDGALWVWICRRYGRWTAGHCTLHQRIADWGIERTCYSESRSSGCELPVEEMLQSGGNHWTAWLQSYHSFLHNSFAREGCLMRYAYA